MPRRLSYNFFILTGFLISGLIGHAQSPSNKPTTATQVPSPSGTVATTPGSYMVSGQSPLVNFVRERDAMGRITDTTLFGSAGYIDVKETTHYFDGLGRPLQTVNRQTTPDANPLDIITPVVYDAFGREVFKYLPYVSTTANSNDGSFKKDPFNDQKNFYQNIYPSQQPAYTGEQVYYSQTNFETSPLNRTLKALAPGNSWAGSDNGVSMKYQVNTNSDSVRIWTISNDSLNYSGNNITTNIPTSSSSYDSGSLYKNVTIDEQGHASVAYKDKDGLVILKKVQIGTVATDFSGYSGWLCTYYVFDDMNQLRFVMSPKAVKIIFANSWNVSADTTAINELCFRYEYDYRQRMLGKKVPGAGWAYMVYDMRDRMVYSQDANMRANSQWLSTLYDGQNRPVTTGMLTYTGNRSSLQAQVTSETSGSSTSPISVSGSTPAPLASSLDLTNTKNGDYQALNLITLDTSFQTPDTVDFTAEIVPGGTSGSSFTNIVTVTANPLPSGANFIALTMSFYDDYGNTPEKIYTPQYNNLLDGGANQHAETLPTSSDEQGIQTLGLLTAKKVRVIEDPSDLTKGQWLATASFYDDRARIVQTQTDNYKGGQDTLTTRYNFTGQVITSYLAHANPVATTANNTRIKTDMNYDFANRLLQVYMTINDIDGTKRLIAQNTYDKLGQMTQRQLGQLSPGGSFLEAQDFSYNIRGWLKGINKDYVNNDNSHGGNSRWFGMELDYDWGFDHNVLNGNIGGIKWRSKGDGQQRSYGFGYDPMNRLLYSDFNQYGSSWDKTAGIDFSIVMGNGTDPSTAYDENGNIKAMVQVGWKLGGSTPIDSLNYTYFTSSNKLQNVIDGRNDPTTTLGDFRTSSLSPYNTGKTAAAQDYYYDPDGNMIRDLNKDIGSQTVDGIIYNHLNLPCQIIVRSATGTKGTINYIYDAEGNKLKKTTVDSSGNVEAVTTYIGAFQYQGRHTLEGSGTPSDTLQFFGHEEGRVRVIQDTVGGQSTISYKYDYFLKDHLDNTRMVLTDEQETDMYPAATMELADSSLENLYYSKLDSCRSGLPPGYPTDTTTNPNSYVTKLEATGGIPKIGPGITLKVMAGDQFSIRVSSWYKLNGNSPNAPVNPLPDLLSALISGVGGLPSTGHPSVIQLNGNSSILSSNLTNFLSDTGSTIVQTRPHAFVNWVLFDNQLNFVASSSGFDQVGTDQEFHHHILTNLSINKSGYLYIYLSNETPNIPVYFDNLQITHVRGPLLEEDHYYPFGLIMSGLSDKTNKMQYSENKYKFIGQLFDDELGWDVYQMRYRSMDPQLGRFWQIDPLATKYVYNSTFAYSSNRVIDAVDVEGLEPEPDGEAREDFAAYRKNYRRVNSYIPRATSFRNSGNFIPNQAAGSAPKPADIYDPLKPGTGEQFSGPFVTKGNPFGSAGVLMTQEIDILREDVSNIKITTEHHFVGDDENYSILMEVKWKTPEAEKAFNQLQDAYDAKVQMIINNNRVPEAPGANASPEELWEWAEKLKKAVESVNIGVALLGPSPRQLLYSELRDKNKFQQINSTFEYLPQISKGK